MKSEEIWRRIKYPYNFVKIAKITKTEVTVYYLYADFKILGCETSSIEDFLNTWAFDEEMTKLAPILEII